MLRRKLVCILVSLALLISLSGTVYASGTEPLTLAEPDLAAPLVKITPLSLLIQSSSATLTIGTYGEATATGRMICYAGTDTIIMFLYLQRYYNGSWQNFNSWNGSYASYYATLTGYDVVPHGYYYRVKGSFYAYSGSTYEHVYEYSGTIYY